MIWATTLGKLEYYLIGVFMLSYILYLVRLIIITLSHLRADAGNVLKKILLRCTYFSLLIVSMLGPSFGDVKKEAKSIGKDLFIVVDVSLSMSCTDIFPSRLEWCKRELDFVLDNLKFNDRVGLIAYAGEAAIQCPLTYDTDAVRLYLRSLRAGMLPGGSNLNVALILASEKLLSKKAAQQTSSAVLIATDGESFSSDISRTATHIAKNNIAFVSLGIGTPAGGNIKLEKELKKDAHGNLVTTKLERTYLLQLAKKANGRYFEITENTTPTVGLLQHINSLAVSVQEVKKIETTTNKYYYFLFAALLLMAIDVITTVNIVRI